MGLVLSNRDLLITLECMIAILTVNQTVPSRRSLSFMGATMALGVFTMVQFAVAQNASLQPNASRGHYLDENDKVNFRLTPIPPLLTDGRVFSTQYNSNLWWTLAP